MNKITRRALAGGGVLGGAIGLASALAAPAIAQSDKRRWRMVTSWPKRLPGPGMSAERVAERIGSLSGGRLEITVSAAGEVVPAFEVLDAVGSGFDRTPRCVPEVGDRRGDFADLQLARLGQVLHSV